MSEHEGRFFGSMSELQYDVLRYQAKLGVETTIEVLKPNMTMKFKNGDKITWYFIEKYEDIWNVSGFEFSQVMLDLSLGLLDRQGFTDTLQYIQSRLRRPGRHK